LNEFVVWADWDRSFLWTVSVWFYFSSRSFCFSEFSFGFKSHFFVSTSLHILE
jgi:CCR4-NOT transcription complex subunit 2